MWMNLFVQFYVCFLIAGLILMSGQAYFIPSLALFIVSAIKKNKGQKTGIAAKHKLWKIHLIISSVIIIIGIIFLICGFVSLFLIFFTLSNPYIIN